MPDGTWLVYRHRQSGIAAPISLVPLPDFGRWGYSGILDRLADYRQARLLFNIPFSVTDRIELEAGGFPQRLIVDGQALDSTVIFEAEMPSLQPGDPERVAGLVINGDDETDVVALNDPLPLIAIALGALVVICVAQLIVSAVTVNAAHKRLTDAGAAPELVLAGTSGEDIEVSDDGSPKLHLSCKFKARVRPTRRTREIEPQEFDLVEQ